MSCSLVVPFFFFFLALSGTQANSSTECKKFSLPGDKTSFYEFLSAFFEDNEVNSATSVSTTWCPNDEDLVTGDINRLKIWMTSQIRNVQQERREISEKFLQKLEEVNKAGEGVKSNLLDLTTIVQKRKEEVSKLCSADVSAIREAMTDMKKGFDEEREAREREREAREREREAREREREARETEREARETQKEARENELNDVKQTLDENDNSVRELKDNVNKILERQLREFHDCSDVLASGESRTGVYTIYPSSGLAARVFCDMETTGGGWTVLLARMNQSEQLNFYRDWEDYKKGFGSPEGEYWLGNDNLHRLTSARNYVIRLEAEDYEGAHTWGEWNSFEVDSENEMYRLKVGDYNAQSTAPDILLSYNNGQSFTAKDLDNDSHSSLDCASYHKGGFWFNHCSHMYPTSVYGLKEHPEGLGVYDWTKNELSSHHYVRSLQLKMRRVK